MTRTKIHAIFKRFQQQNPHPKTELQYTSPFELLVAVILSAQATDKTVNKATEVLFGVANTPEAIIALGEQGIKQYIRSIGLYQNKAHYILETAKRIHFIHDNHVPDNRKDLEALAGVGRKTANVILNICFHQPTIAVDTHIFRVAQRIGLASGKTPLAVEKKLLSCIPTIFKQYAHHWLILHGRYSCTARKPKCQSCLIQDLCAYNNKKNMLNKNNPI